MILVKGYSKKVKSKNQIQKFIRRGVFGSFARQVSYFESNKDEVVSSSDEIFSQ